jgi:DNA-binding NtrC family response regulator
LARSELFGHKKGAFTGALSEAQGAFADADGGTLFLDEIGELPLEIQPMLLRALETGSVTRIGESKARPLNVRLIAATHRTLKEDSEAGLFRQDLYFRLMVVRLLAPALRERTSDLLMLTDHLCDEAGLRPLSAEVKSALSKRSFPGNVRELKHAILAYGAIGELPDDASPGGEDLDQALLPFINTDLAYADQKEALVDRATRLYLARLIEDVGGNRSEAARRAGLQRGYLRRLLEKYGLD